MRALIAALLALLLGIPAVHAQGALPATLGLYSAGKYTGPLDIVGGALFAGGVRAPSKAWAIAGGKLLNVCYDLAGVDQACVDMVSNAQGQLVVTTVGGFSCGVVICTAKIIYDGSGNGNDATQATVASRATFTLNCLNTNIPCLTSTQNAVYYVTISSSATVQSATTVAERTGAFTSESEILGAAGQIMFQFNMLANQAAIINASSQRVAVTASDSTFHSMQFVSQTGANASSITVDGTMTAESLTAQTTGTTFALFQNIGPNPGTLYGNVAEAVFHDGVAYTSTQITNLCDNERLYFGTSGTC